MLLVKWKLVPTSSSQQRHAWERAAIVLSEDLNNWMRTFLLLNRENIDCYLQLVCMYSKYMFSQRHSGSFCGCSCGYRKNIYFLCRNRRRSSIIEWHWQLLYLLHFLCVQYSLTFSSVFGLLQPLREISNIFASKCSTLFIQLVSNFVCLLLVLTRRIQWAFFQRKRRWESSGSGTGSYTMSWKRSRGELQVQEK